MIDIHSHVRVIEGVPAVQELLQDTKEKNISKRYISTFEGNTIQEGNEMINDLVKNNLEVLGGCAVINPALASAVEDVKHALSLEHIEMIEFDSYRHGYYPDNTPILFDVFDEIQNTNITVKVFVGIGAKAMPHQWEILAKRYPTVNFIFLHMGCFDYGYGCIDVIKRNPNIYTETSNQYEMQILDKAFSELDSSKILFGTTYPERLTRSGIEIFELFDIKDEDIDNIMFKNAEKIIKR